MYYINMDIEFKGGDIVTLDRYNHIDDVEVVPIVEVITDHSLYGRLTYVMDVRGTKIKSSGISIMESKYYEPVPDNERHCKII